MLGLLCLSGCGPSESSVTPGARVASIGEGHAAPGSSEQTAVADEPTCGREVLEAMAAAYRNATNYADSGTARLRAETSDGPIEQSADFSVTLERPNKLRMHMYEAVVVCDGRELLASVKSLPNQVLVKKAPAELTGQFIYGDPVLQRELGARFAGPSPQTNLLLADDALRGLLHNAKEITLQEAGEIDGRQCHRVAIRSPEGTGVFWIDRKTYALRRVEYPTDVLRRHLSQGTEVRSVSLVTDFRGAQFDAPIDPAAFQFEVPPSANRVRYFVEPPQVELMKGPSGLLGKRVPAFQFTDLAGQSITPESLAGKIAVLDFWATHCEPCRRTLPSLCGVYDKLGSDPRIVVVAVSVDEPRIADQTLIDTFKSLGVDLPIARDLKQDVFRAFHVEGIPAMLILDGKGIVQDVAIGPDPDLAATLPKKLDRLLAGEQIYHERLDAYKSQTDEHRRALEAARPIPQKSQPKTFSLAPLWQCPGVKEPGNILVVQDGSQAPRLIVISRWMSVAEVTLDGKVVATEQLPVERTGPIYQLRTGVGRDGKRRFAAFAAGQSQFHLFDERLNFVLSFPKSVADNVVDNAMQITDVQLGNLDGSGVLNAYVGYFGKTGVQAVSLEGSEGSPIWSSSSIAEVLAIAFTGPDPEGRRRLCCANSSGKLAMLDAAGNLQGEVAVPGRFLYSIAGADLQRNGNLLWCGLSQPRQKPPTKTALGFDLHGDQLWTHPIPVGSHQYPVERIIPGRLAPVAAAQWILPGPDGSIRVIAADGCLLDQFNYGGELTGLATIERGGRTMLVVSSTEGLQAWLVE